MKNRFSLLCSAALFAASSVCAQTEVRMDMYVPLFNSGEWYDSQNFESWEPGQNPEENFFISRVRPRERFVNEKHRCILPRMLKERRYFGGCLSLMVIGH